MTDSLPVVGGLKDAKIAGTGVNFVTGEKSSQLAAAGFLFIGFLGLGGAKKPLKWLGKKVGLCGDATKRCPSPKSKVHYTDFASEAKKISENASRSRGLDPNSCITWKHNKPPVLNMADNRLNGGQIGDFQRLFRNNKVTEEELLNDFGIDPEDVEEIVGRAKKCKNKKAGTHKHEDKKIIDSKEKSNQNFNNAMTDFTKGDITQADIENIHTVGTQEEGISEAQKKVWKLNKKFKKTEDDIYP